jgi:AraC-like DNA-binding protein
MQHIKINADTSAEILTEIKDAIGGTIQETWGEHKLIINNLVAKGYVKFIPFDYGVSLLHYDVKFFEEVELEIKATEFNPIRFIYNLQDGFKHKFGVDNSTKNIEQFQSVIFTNKTNGSNSLIFPKDSKIEINIIHIVRAKFLKKRTSNIASLNDKLYEVFVDTDHEHRFFHHGRLNLKMADFVNAIKKIKSKGMLRLLKIEAKVYEILTLHIQQHNLVNQGVPLPTSLIKRELKIVRQLGKKITENPAKNYSLNQLSKASGLSQVKLQDGFKFLFNRTVTEYIRHIRLETSRELIKTTDLNISQIVYSIGFTSRSYFSKIFKEKYGVTPYEYKKQVYIPVAV